MSAVRTFGHAVRAATRSRSRGAAELGVVVMGASLVGGLVFGSGLTRTAVDVFDGSTWFSDSPRGEVLQVNAATGRPEVRLAVGKPGDDLDVAQQQGRLVVTNHGTGAVTSIDLATLLASGRRASSSGSATQVLLHGGLAFLVDRKAGTVSNVDPVSLSTIGRVWQAPHGMTDVAIDGTGMLWALGDGGQLTGLTWSPDSAVFSADEERTVPGLGSGSELVAHDTGVTIFAPATGAVVQIGTDHDLVTAAPAMRGALAVADDSPSDFVPASATDAGTVVIVGPSEVRQVDVRPLGCAKPGQPVVFGDLVYVPCQDSNRVIRLDRQGRHSGDDIVTGTKPGDPQLVLDNGRLYVNVPGADTGVQVLPDGSTHGFVRYDPAVPAQPVRAAEPPKKDEPKKTDTKADEDRKQGQQNANVPRWSPPNPVVTVPVVTTSTSTTTTPLATTSTTATPSTPSWTKTTSATTRPTSQAPTGGPATQTVPPTTEAPAPQQPAQPPPDPAQAPSAVSASAPGDGSVIVSWQHGGPAATSFTVTRAGDSTPLATAGGGARSATVTSLPAGTSVQLVVIATFADGSTQTSGASNAVVASPGMPTENAPVVTALVYNRVSAIATVTLAPPADWAGFAGTCVLHADYAAETPVIPCSSTSASVTLYDPGTGELTSPVNVWVEASTGGQVAHSATYTTTVRWAPIGGGGGGGCQNPSEPRAASMKSAAAPELSPTVCQIP